YNVNVFGAVAADGDRLTINGSEGDDQITVGAGANAVLNLTLNGNDGNDVINAGATLASAATAMSLNGNDGNDTLIGGGDDDTMDGGAGDDTFIGNGGTDAIGGGAGNSVGDTILVSGTAGSDAISLSLDVAGHLVATVNGLTTTYTNFIGGPIASSGIEQIRVQAL